MGWNVSQSHFDGTELREGGKETAMCGALFCLAANQWQYTCAGPYEATWNRSREMYSPVQQNTRKQWHTSAFDEQIVESARGLLFSCVLLHWWVHFPRAVLFCQPHQQLFAHTSWSKILFSETYNNIEGSGVHIKVMSTVVLHFQTWVSDFSKGVQTRLWNSWRLQRHCTGPCQEASGQCSFDGSCVHVLLLLIVLKTCWKSEKTELPFYLSENHTSRAR